MNFRKLLSTMFFTVVLAASVIGMVRFANADEIANTLNSLYRHAPGADRLFKRAAGVLVFPTIVKAGMGIGGEYGEGDLLIGGRPVGHYNTVSASIGFQLGAEARSVVIMFMTPESLELPARGRF
jgi:lipid-binding SYLF domain-containing protein